MDKPVFILEMPDLSDEAVSDIQDFLWYVVTAFESRYFHQLQQYHHKLERERQLDE